MSSLLLLPKLAGLKLVQEYLLGLWLHLNCSVNGVELLVKLRFYI